MPEAVSNTSPLLYLYRIEAIDWLPHLFIWAPDAVRGELLEGRAKGYDAPDIAHILGWPWIWAQVNWRQWL